LWHAVTIAIPTLFPQRSACGDGFDGSLRGEQGRNRSQAEGLVPYNPVELCPTSLAGDYQLGFKEDL
jgi:hypothetical protein